MTVDGPSGPILQGAGNRAKVLAQLGASFDQVSQPDGISPTETGPSDDARMRPRAVSSAQAVFQRRGSLAALNPLSGSAAGGVRPSLSMNSLRRQSVVSQPAPSPPITSRRATREASTASLDVIPQSADSPAEGDEPSEEIVPWLYQADKSQSTPSTSNSTPVKTPLKNSVASQMYQNSSKNGSAAKLGAKPPMTTSTSSSTIGSGSINGGSEPRERKTSRSLMSLLKRKTSSMVVSNDSSADSKSKKTNGSPVDKSSKPTTKQKKKLPSISGAISLSQHVIEASPVSPTIALDTNLDSMEGIIDTTKPNAAHRESDASVQVRPTTPNSRHNSFAVGDYGPSETPPHASSRRPSADTPWMQSIQNGHLAIRRGSPGDMNIFTGRRMSTASASLAPPFGLAPPIPNSAGWTAPDSWAVKPGEMGEAEESDDDDDDDEDGEEEVIMTLSGALPSPAQSNKNPSISTQFLPPNLKDEDNSSPVSIVGPLPGRRPSFFAGAVPPAPVHDGPTPHGPRQFGSTASLFGGYALSRSSDGRPPSAAGRRLGSNSAFGPGYITQATPVSKNFAIRIFRTDGQHTTILCPVHTTTAELLSIVSRKPGFAPPSQASKSIAWKLYIRERGLERLMNSSERPLILQKRKFEQAGYNDIDKLDDLGREDHSYLCRIIYKPEMEPAFNMDQEGFDGFDKVDLQGRGLQSIPIFLYKHAHDIVSLTLSRNYKLDLPSDFIHLCVSMRELRMSEMGIKRVPQSVRQISGLSRLDISNNRIPELDHCNLDEITDLGSLKAANNRLNALPDYFGKFAALRYLSLASNRFETFPVIVCQIESLVELDVSFNYLTTLPMEMGKLVKLERLIMVSNNIVNLPESLSSLQALRELDVRRNAIVDFSVLKGIEKLENIRCENNAAVAFHISIGKLKSIHGSHNALTQLHFTASDATLTYLNLSNNKLTSIPADLFDNLINIESLILDHNKLHSLHDNIGKLNHLVRLSCKQNALDSIPAAIGKLAKLTMLDLSGNSIKTIPPEIWLCTDLSTLNLSSNLLDEFPDPPSIDATPEDPERKPSNASSSSRSSHPLSASLMNLYLADNHFEQYVFPPLSLFTFVRVLNLSFNDIYEIPSNCLRKNAALEELYLSGNKITTLPADDLETLQNLRVLHLNGNKLQTLPAELGKINRLQVLDVGTNVLKYNIANWPYDWNWNWNLELRYLNLSGNKRLEIKPGNNAHDSSPSHQRRNLADFTALRKIRVLGLMDVTLTTSAIPDDSDERRVRTSLSELNEMGYGIADSLGRNDRLTTIDMVMPRFRSREDECVFGMFDAKARGHHSGGRLVKFLQDSLAATLTLELSRLRDGDDVQDAMRRTFLTLNRDYGNSLVSSWETRRKDSEPTANGERYQSVSGGVDIRSGASGVVVYITRKTMYVANAGNALAVLAGRGGAARQVSIQHDFKDPEETARVRHTECWVSAKGLLNDEIEVSRSFGYYHVVPAVNAAPSVFTIDLSESDEFIILGNRGFWDVVSPKSAVDVARKERADPMIAASKLRDLALGYGADQSVMVMIVSVGDLFHKKKSMAARGLSVSDDSPYDSQRLARRGPAGFGERYLGLLDAEVRPPTGRLALVFTDIRNSTKLWDSNEPSMRAAIRIHNELFRRQLRACGGYECKTEGDAFMVSFSTVTSALLWCFTVQLELLREDWPQDLLDNEEGKELYSADGELIYRGLSVRMGIHCGTPMCEVDPVSRRMDYLGPMVNRSARVQGVAEGGQIAASADVVEVIKAVCFKEHKPAEAEEGDEVAESSIPPEYRDQATPRDIEAIRQLGVVIHELGERRLKGLETPELISLIWPTQLAGRLAGPVTEEVAEGQHHNTEIMQPTPRQLDLQVVIQIMRCCLRLESAIAPPYTIPGTVLADKLQHVIGRFDSTDEQLYVVLESFVNRIENVVNTLTLRQLGPIADVLAALGQTTRIDVRYLTHALNMMGRMYQQTETSSAGLFSEEQSD